nr:hypothetical protein [Tanacetum cinerariifolium]
MATTIDQQTALDESLVPTTQREFQVTADVSEIYMQEFWATAKLHHNFIDDALFSTIKVVSRHQTTQQYGAILPIELTTDEIKNRKAYKEYYACAMGEAVPKPKASARKKKGESASSTTPPTPTPTTTVESALRLSATAKGKQP